MEIDQFTTGVQKQGEPAGIKIEQPLGARTIKGIQKLAFDNRAAYNKVFTHTPRDGFKTMRQGRQAYGVTTNGTTQLNLTGLPALQSTYMKSGKHDVVPAMAVLKVAVKGFWVEMPLEWGGNQNKTPEPPLGSPSLIATHNPIANEVQNT